MPKGKELSKEQLKAIFKEWHKQYKERQDEPELDYKNADEISEANAVTFLQIKEEIGL